MTCPFWWDFMRANTTTLRIRVSTTARSACCSMQSKARPVTQHCTSPCVPANSVYTAEMVEQHAHGCSHQHVCSLSSEQHANRCSHQPVHTEYGCTACHLNSVPMVAVTSLYTAKWSNSLPMIAVTSMNTAKWLNSLPKAAFASMYTTEHLNKVHEDRCFTRQQVHSKAPSPSLCTCLDSKVKKMLSTMRVAAGGCLLS